MLVMMEKFIRKFKFTYILNLNALVRVRFYFILTKTILQYNMQRYYKEICMILNKCNMVEIVNTYGLEGSINEFTHFTDFNTPVTLDNKELHELVYNVIIERYKYVSC